MEFGEPVDGAATDQAAAARDAIALQELRELQQCGLQVSWPRANAAAAHTRVPPRAPEASNGLRRLETADRVGLADESVAELRAFGFLLEAGMRLS